MAGNNGNANVPANVVLLPAINDSREDWSILVRVIRMWRVLDYATNRIPFTVELVLMDHEGNRIHATVKKQFIYKFEKDLDEDSVYYMSKFGVVPNVGEYRTTRHAFKLDFQLVTKLRKVSNDAVPVRNYLFTPPAYCFQPDFEREYLVDIIGVLTGVGTSHEYTRNGVKSKLMNIELDNRGYRFKYTLFGHFVDELNSFIASGEATNAVLAILFSKVKTWHEQTSIQTTMHSSKIIYNPDIPEAVVLRSKLTENSDSPNPCLSQLRDSKSKTIKEEFLNETERTTIAELKECNEAKDFVVHAAVNCLIDSYHWWYHGCNCHKKVYQDSNMYFCERCNRHVVVVTPRYLLKLRVIDDDESTTFVLFDRDAAKLIKKSCAELVESINVDPNGGSIPTEISDITGKSYLFKIHCDGKKETRFEI